MVIGNLLYSYTFNEYPMWKFHHTFEQAILPTTMSINLLKTFTSFPLLTLIFLSNYPEGRKIIGKLTYVTIWTMLFIGIELISYVLGMISYHNGWNIWWSVMFNFMMFSLLALHYKKPLIALFISLIYITILCRIFDLNFFILE
jgi:hypothetical protein